MSDSAGLRRTIARGPRHVVGGLSWLSVTPRGQAVLVIGASGESAATWHSWRRRPVQTSPGASTSKLDLVQSIGADHVIDYTCDDFADGSHRYDAVLDEPPPRNRRSESPVTHHFR